MSHWDFPRAVARKPAIAELPPTFAAAASRAAHGPALSSGGVNSRMSRLGLSMVGDSSSSHSAGSPLIAPNPARRPSNVLPVGNLLADSLSVQSRPAHFSAPMGHPAANSDFSRPFARDRSQPSFPSSHSALATAPSREPRESLPSTMSRRRSTGAFNAQAGFDDLLSVSASTLSAPIVSQSQSSNRTGKQPFSLAEPPSLHDSISTRQSRSLAVAPREETEQFSSKLNLSNSVCVTMSSEWNGVDASGRRPTKMQRAKDWSAEIEMAFRLDQCGWRDVDEFRSVYGEPEVWPRNGWLRTLRLKKNGFFCYFSETRECPDNLISRAKVYSYD